MRVVFAGTPAFSLPCLEALIRMPEAEVAGVVSQPDRRAGRGMKPAASPVKQAAMEAGIGVLTPARLAGNTQAEAWLRQKAPDVLVVVAFGMLLPGSWLDIPGCGAVNVHASLLPRWRGAAPIERAMLAGDDETGVCIMHMEEGLDTGGVYACRRTGIGARMTSAELRRRLSILGAELLIETLPRILAGELEPRPQDDAQATYATKLTNEERIIDWSRSAAAVDRQVRCFSPRPGARTLLHGRWLKVIAGEVLPGSVRKPAGAWLEGDAIDVVCGDGRIYRLLTVQPEGKKAMDAAAFRCGHTVAEGCCFERAPADR